MLSSKLFKKPTAGNTILRSSSSHPKSLVNSIPYSQYIRIKRNCSDYADYKKEANSLKQRLLDRGYSHKCLKQAFNRVEKRKRHDLLFFKKAKPPEIQNSRIITTYTNDHSRVKGILDKYWHLLTSDPTVGPLVPLTPRIAYRWATSVGDLIVQSEFWGSTRGDPCKFTGTYPCGSCNYCKYMDRKKNIWIPNGSLYIPWHFSNCLTMEVAYFLQCSCGCYYIGKIIQKLWQRISRHIRAMKMSESDSPWGRHVAQAHNGVFPKISLFWIVFIPASISPSFNGSWDGYQIWMLPFHQALMRSLISNHSYQAFHLGVLIGTCKLMIRSAGCSSYALILWLV